jgi:hypothetical protein
MSGFAKAFLTALLLCVAGLIGGGASVAAQAPPAENPQSGSIGIEGIVSGAAPATAPTITFPTTGSVITELPVTVTGVCQTGYIVKVFKNNVFGGSTVCVNGSYSIQIDLFTGRNELVARMYDDLDQPGPDSNKVTVTYPFNVAKLANRISLTSNYAKRGAAPGETLTWPITLSGGVGPYAITIDWGDGKVTDVISQEFPGNFTASHIYDSAGLYNIIIRAVDKNGDIAFLQLIGVGNGELTQASGEGTGAPEIREIVRVLWWPAAFAIPLTIISYWLGKKSALAHLRKQLGQK